MPIHCLKVPLEFIREDVAFPDLDRRHIYDHLRYFCSKIFPLPALDVVFVNQQFVVTNGHIYLRVARDLGYPWARAFYQSDSSDPQSVLAGFPQGVEIIPRESLDQELAQQVVRDYQVFFFHGGLTVDEQRCFITNVAGFFERLDSPLLQHSKQRLFRWAFSHGDECVEFQALIPVGDPTWLAPYLQTCRKFSREVRRILSFQGARFPE
jgi:hypothetical protein